jgi:hypothetical protein
MRQRAQELQQRDKPQPTKTVWAIGSMEWLPEQKEAGSKASIRFGWGLTSVLIYSQVRNGLFAGGSEIRTLGPPPGRQAGWSAFRLTPILVGARR